MSIGQENCVGSALSSHGNMISRNTKTTPHYLRGRLIDLAVFPYTLVKDIIIRNNNRRQKYTVNGILLS